MVEPAVTITTKKRGRPGRPRKNKPNATLSNFTIAQGEVDYKQKDWPHLPAFANANTDSSSNGGSSGSSKQVFRINRFEPLSIVHQAPTALHGKGTTVSTESVSNDSSSNNDNLTPSQQNSDEAISSATTKITHSSHATIATAANVEPLTLPQVHFQIVTEPLEDPSTRLLSLLKDDDDDYNNDQLTEEEESGYLQQQKSQEDQLLAAMQQQQQAQQPDYEYYNFFYKKKKSNELLFQRPKMHYIHYRTHTEAELYDLIEYDMDEQDYYWVQAYNKDVRRKEKLDDLSPLLFETIMDKLEKEWFNLIKDIPSRLVTYNQCTPMYQHFSSNNTAQHSLLSQHSVITTTADSTAVVAAALSTEEDDSACAVCDDTEVENSNAIVFCDGCNVPVHQDCYGIPYIPEGQWLCKKCSVLSPESQVSCVFCPNKGGAFKQTTTNEWSHVLCAIWIPEVNVQNPIYMEPIDDIDKIPKSRWKLTCSICRVKRGACIQCDNRHCFTAFHVTCAKAAKLCMRIHTHANHTEGVLLKAYCEKHTPTDYILTNGEDGEEVSEQVAATEAVRSDDDEQQSTAAIMRGDETDPEEDGYINGIHSNNSRKRAPTTYAFGGTKIGRNGRKSMANDCGSKKTITEQSFVSQTDAVEITHSKLMRAFQQHYSRGVPIVPDFILEKIDHLECVRSSGIRRRSEVVTDIAHYWSLKRESKKGAPLLKRLQLEPWSTVPRYTPEDTLIRKSVMRELRDDLQEVRYLAEQVQDRELLKLERLQQQQSYLNMILHPLYHIIQFLVTRFKNLDQKKKAFWYPVTEKEAPGYRKIIKQPMSFYDIEQKIEKHLYTCLDEFKQDIALIWTNCMEYNSKTSSYYKLAVKLKTASEKLFQTADEKMSQFETVDGAEDDMWKELIDPGVFDYEVLVDKRKKITISGEKTPKTIKPKQEKAEEHRKNIQARSEGQKKSRQTLLQQQQHKEEQQPDQQQKESANTSKRYPPINDVEAKNTHTLRRLRSRQTDLFEFIQPVKANPPRILPASSSPPMHQEVQNLLVQQSPPMKPVANLLEPNEQNTNTEPSLPASNEVSAQQKGTDLQLPSTSTLASHQSQELFESPTALQNLNKTDTTLALPFGMGFPDASLHTRSTQHEAFTEAPSADQQISTPPFHTDLSQTLQSLDDKAQSKVPTTTAHASAGPLSYSNTSAASCSLPLPQSYINSYNTVTPPTIKPTITATAGSAAFSHLPPHPPTENTTTTTANGISRQENSRKRSHSQVENSVTPCAITSNTTTISRPTSLSQRNSSSSTNSTRTNDSDRSAFSSISTTTTSKSTTTASVTARRRVTRSIGLQVSIEEIRKRPKISHEAQALVASYNGVSNIEETIEKKKRTYKENRKIHAPLGWVYLASDDDDDDDEVEELEKENKGEVEAVVKDDYASTSKKRKREDNNNDDDDDDDREDSHIDIESMTEIDGNEQYHHQQQEKKRNRGGRNDIPIPSFKRGEIVWAKVDGFPSHPAKFLNYSDEEAGPKLVANRRYQGDILVEFLEVPELHRFGWVGRRTICELGENPDIDKRKLTEAARTKNSKRAQEAKDGYRCAGSILGLKDTESILQAVFDKSKQKHKKKKPKRSS